MKNFIKLLFVFLAWSMSTATFAQTIGIRAGLNLANVLAKDDMSNYGDSYKSTPGAHFGVTGDFPITDLLSFEAGILASTKGFKEEITIESFGITSDIKTQLNTVYVDVPLTVKAKFGVGSTKFFVQAGPYVSLGVTGNIRSEVTVAGETAKDDTKIKWGSADGDDLKSLDYGITVGAGVMLSGFQVGLSYWSGLANISAYQEMGTKISNRNLMISLGYNFGGQ